MGVGRLPSELGKLTNLNTTFTYSYLSYGTGTIPTELGKLSMLSEDLKLAGLRRTTGTIPSELGRSCAHVSFASPRPCTCVDLFRE